MSELRDVLYIVSFGLFILGLSGLTGPTTAVRGNRIAAAGMAVAVVATLLRWPIDNVALIALGVVAGTAVGVPAARRVQMTQMPQMVALFNGVGGGAVALIAWAEFRSSSGYAEDPTYVAIFSVFAAIVGSISFWGSNVAFAKLQELIPGRPITLGRLQTPLNALLATVAVGAGVALAAGAGNEWLMVTLLVAAAVLANLLVLPIGGADMPVVISLLNAFTGLSAAATGVALDNQAMIVAGHARRSVGLAAHAADGGGDEPVHPRDRRGRLRRRRRVARRRVRARRQRAFDRARPTSRSSWRTPSRS